MIESVQRRNEIMGKKMKFYATTQKYSLRFEVNIHLYSLLYFDF